MLPVSYPHQRLISQPFQKSQGAAPLLLDAIATTVLAYSTRKLNTSYAGNCLRLRDDNDNGEKDFGFTGDPPVLDTAAITSWLVGNGFVTTWYDQSGNGRNATQSTAANQPAYNPTSQNNLPGLTGSNANATHLQNIAKPQLSAATWFWAAQTNNTTLQQRFVGNPTTGFYWARHLSGSFRYWAWDGVGAVVTVANIATTMNLWTARTQQSEKKPRLRKNGGVESVGSAVAGDDQMLDNIETDMHIMSGRTGNNCWDGEVVEMILLGEFASEDTITTVQDSINTYWAIY